MTSIPFRAELAPFLVEFAEHHRGVRLGKMFGVPAIYVGRKLACCIMDKGIIVRLPDDAARCEIQAKRGQPFSRRGRVMGSWVMYTPRTATAARRLTPTLEIAVRNIAEHMTEEITGVRIGPANRLRQGRVALRPDETALAGRSALPADRPGGPPKLHAKAEAGPYAKSARPYAKSGRRPKR